MKNKFGSEWKIVNKNLNEKKSQYFVDHYTIFMSLRFQLFQSIQFGSSHFNPDRKTKIYDTLCQKSTSKV
jgi:hypothetical protein